MPNENKRLRVDVIFVTPFQDKTGEWIDKATWYPEQTRIVEGCLVVLYDDDTRYAYPLHNIKRIKETEENV